MRYEIWQMPPNGPNRFLHYDWCKHPIDIMDYVYVYTGNITPLKGEKATDLLERIFEILNVDWPVDYHAASLSTSDIVCLIDKQNRRHWYYVDGIGFKKLDWNY